MSSIFLIFIFIYLYCVVSLCQECPKMQQVISVIFFSYSSHCQLLDSWTGPRIRGILLVQCSTFSYRINPRHILEPSHLWHLRVSNYYCDKTILHCHIIISTTAVKWHCDTLQAALSNFLLIIDIPYTVPEVTTTIVPILCDECICT